MAEIPIGVVSETWRHPVKGMEGYKVVDPLYLGQHGFVNNRVVAFLTRYVSPSERIRSRECLTGRDYPEMVLYKASLNPNSDSAFGIEVLVPEGKIYPAESEELLEYLEKQSGKRLTFCYREEGIYDQAVLSILSLDSLGRLQNNLGGRGNVNVFEQRQRFREDMFIELDSGIADTEDDFVNRRLVIGYDLSAAVVEITERDPRCKMVNIDPKTGVSEQGVLQTIGKMGRGRFGVYAGVIQPGMVSAGNRVYLVD